MTFEQGLSTFTVGQHPNTTSTDTPPQQGTGYTTAPEPVGLPQLTSGQQNVIPLYMNTLKQNGDPVADVAITKLSAPAGGTGSQTNAGTEQTSNTRTPLLNDPTAMARRQAREADSRTNTYGESDPSSGGTQAVIRGPDPESLRIKNSRLLTEAEKDLLREKYNIAGINTVDLDQVRVHEDENDKPFYMPKNAEGMTHENHIYIQTTVDSDGNKVKYSYNEPSTHKILAHEVQHVQQFQNGMTRAGYLWDAGTKGYAKSKYEIDAKLAEQPRAVNGRTLYK